MLEYEWVMKHVKLEGEVVVDVGAHHGHYAIVLASMKPNKLTCVDAVASNCDITTVNLALNDFSAMVKHAAVSTRDGVVQFTGESNGRVVERGVIEVPSLRLTTLCPDATVVKLDIEGEEFKVIPDQLNAMTNVHTWIIEVHPWKTRNPQDLLPLLTSRFETHWLNKSAGRFEAYPADADWSTHTTVICQKR